MPRYIYGEDPASQNDFFGIVIHEMPTPTIDNPKPVPFLRDIYKLNHTSFDKIIEFHTRVLFPKFPPRLMVFDYTMFDIEYRDRSSYYTALERSNLKHNDVLFLQWFMKRYLKNYNIPEIK